MTDPTRDRPGDKPEMSDDSERRLPARRPPSEPIPSRSAERFTAPSQVRALGGLTSDRAAKIVRQSGDARWIAFLGVAIVALFVIVYYFYELGAPLGLTKPRLAVEEEDQQVTSVERGYNLYEANCARCHGVNGEGGIGPVLNDQMKLFSHLNEQYIHNVLTVGGRYVCGNPKSVMPVWADTNGGPLNYIQIDDLIAFIRAPSTQEFVRRDPQLNEPVIGADGKVQTFKGWLDPNFKPEPSATPFPDCWSGTAAGGSQAPAETLGPDATILKLTAASIAYDVKELTGPAGKAFGIDFKQEDAGVGGHNVEIRDSGGQTLFKGQVLTDPGETTYSIPALTAGTYTYICSIHPIPQMTGTLTVK
jgi:mono/diheme cytochrome c family protein/plastocyanin